MDYIIDISVIAIILFCASIGHKNGVLSGIITIASAVFAFIGAKTFSPIITPFVANFINPMIDKAVATDPTQYLEKFIPTEQLSAFSQLADINGLEITQLLTKELTLLLQDTIAFLIIFVIIIVLSNVVLKYLSLHLPIIKTVNKFLGMCCGTFAGIIIVLLAFSALQHYAFSDNTAISLLPYLEKSFFAKFFIAQL